jgi:hypothetical protein
MVAGVYKKIFAILMQKLSLTHAREKKASEWWQRDVDKKVNRTRQEEFHSYTHTHAHTHIERDTRKHLI